MMGGQTLKEWLAQCSELDLKRNVLVTYQTFDASGLVLVIIRRLKTNERTVNEKRNNPIIFYAGVFNQACMFYCKVKNQPEMRLLCLNKLAIFNNCFV